jgi:hypothetical protein
MHGRIIGDKILEENFIRTQVGMYFGQPAKVWSWWLCEWAWSIAHFGACENGQGFGEKFKVVCSY